MQSEGMSKREGNGENKLKRREIIKGQKGLVDISNLSLFYSLLSWLNHHYLISLKYKMVKILAQDIHFFEKLPVKKTRKHST